MSKVLTICRQLMKLMYGFDRMAKPIELISVSENGKYTFEWKVDESQSNAHGTLHGGYTAFMVDYATSLALVGIGEHKPGNSIELSISYLKPAKIGEIVTMETDCKKLGSSLAFMEATLKNKEGKLLATAKHIKFIGGKTILKDGEVAALIAAL